MRDGLEKKCKQGLAHSEWSRVATCEMTTATLDMRCFVCVGETQRSAPTRTMTSSFSAEALYRSHGPIVYRRALRILGDASEAEEALQEIFIKVLKNRETFQAKAQVTTWLYSITTNYCLNRLRNRKRRRELYDERVAPVAERESKPAPEVSLWAKKVLANAEPRQAEAAVYVYIDGMSHREAAEVMGVSKRTVGNLLERFAKALEKGEEIA
ncbi:MAG: RNA polymerase sigma factor [Myxococcota bacterium]